MVEFIFRLFEPYYATNVARSKAGKHRAVCAGHPRVSLFNRGHASVQVCGLLELPERDVTGQVLRRDGQRPLAEDPRLPGLDHKAQPARVQRKTTLRQ